MPDSRHIVCLDLGDATEFHGARINLMGKVLDRRTIAREGRTADEATDLAVQLAVSLAEDAERPLLGVGIGSPGLVHPGGVVLEAANLRWHGEDLAGAVARRLDLPVHVANDANAAALAEYTFGDAQGQNLLLVKIGEGVGAGLLIDGQIFVGDRFAAGEIGHVDGAGAGRPVRLRSTGMPRDGHRRAGGPPASRRGRTGRAEEDVRGRRPAPGRCPGHPRQRTQPR